jgi:hypothetical protein
MDDLAFRRREMLKNLLDDPLFKEAIDDVSTDLMSAIRSTGMQQSDLRENYYFEFLALERIVGKLNAYAGEVVFVRAAREKERQRG